MTDRELLESAAKAAGYAIHAFRQADRDRDYPEQIGLWIPDESTCWNPLVDSGHALRLAVKLGLLVDAGAHTASDGGPNRYGQVGERDPYAATRRAIVRAAAALGEAA